MFGRLQRRIAGPDVNPSRPGSGVVPPLVHRVLRSPGRPLSPSARSFMEPRFGQDFGRVRIHTDAQASASARALNANAYTVGSHVVFGGGPGPDSPRGRRLLAHELAHVLQQRAAEPPRSLSLASPQDSLERVADVQAKEAMGLGGVSTRSATTDPLIQREAAGVRAPETAFDACDPAQQADLRAKHQPALENVDRAIRSLQPTWNNMDPTDKAAFRQYFDPANSGEIDDGFVRDVRNNFQRIRNYMGSLRFDCNQDSWTICGDGHKWCTGGRLMWTCFGNLHVCPAYATSTDESFKIETIIHESTHNALHTTDREYSNSATFNRLRPRGSGLLSFLSNIPILGALFRMIGSNNDTLYNPDSYARYAMQAGRATP